MFFVKAQSLAQMFSKLFILSATGYPGHGTKIVMVAYSYCSTGTFGACGDRMCVCGCGFSLCWYG